MAKDKDKKVKQRVDNVVLTDEDPQRLKKEEVDRPSDQDADDQSEPPADTTDTSDASDEPATAGELDEVKAQLLRITADFENFKRRTQAARAEGNRRL